jgi:hypothetical protein
MSRGAQVSTRGYPPAEPWLRGERLVEFELDDPKGAASLFAATAAEPVENVNSGADTLDRKIDLLPSAARREAEVLAAPGGRWPV